MELNNMILVTENWKGRETNFLLTIEDYKESVVSTLYASPSETVDAITVIGGRIAPKLKMIMGVKFLALAGVIGSVSLFTLSATENIWLIGIALFGFGAAFISLQSTLISTAQEKLPKMRGTAMSLASFNMFVGGAIGTTLNGTVMKNYGASQIFFNTAFILLAVGILATLFVSGYEKRKKEALSLQNEN